MARPLAPRGTPRGKKFTHPGEKKIHIDWTRYAISRLSTPPTPRCRKSSRKSMETTISSKKYNYKKNAPKTTPNRGFFYGGSCDLKMEGSIELSELRRLVKFQRKRGLGSFYFGQSSWCVFWSEKNTPKNERPHAASGDGEKNQTYGPQPGMTASALMVLWQLPSWK